MARAPRIIQPNCVLGLDLCPLKQLDETHKLKCDNNLDLYYFVVIDHHFMAIMWIQSGEMPISDPLICG